MTVKYWGLLSFDLAFTRSKLTSCGILFAKCVIECYGLGNMPRTEWHQLYRKSKRAGLTENLPSPALFTARDLKLIGILTGTALDSGPQPGVTSPALGWSVIAVRPSGRGCWHGGAAEGLLTKIHQNACQKRHFFMSCHKF